MIYMYFIYNDSDSKSGNNTTLTRLSNILNLPLTNNITNNLIGIHAYKFGKKVIDKDINFIIIIGGTDINIDIDYPEKKQVIIKTLFQAKFIITFSQNIKDKVIDLSSSFQSKTKIIPQSVIYKKPNKFNLKNHISNKYNITKINKLFIVVGNLRDVKDPYFLKSLSEELKKDSIYIVYIGSDLDKKYTFSEPFYHLDNLSKKDIYASYSQVDGLINTSKSEGMAVSILEAMLYQCPIFVRNNPGNKSIIKDKFNGFLFNTPEEFYQLINQDTGHIIKNALTYVLEFHNPDLEMKKYNKLLFNL